MGVEQIPVVDFEKCGLDVETVDEKDKRIVGDEVYEALAKIGFVYLKNVGITQQQMDKFTSKTREFFDLDESIKKKYTLNEKFCGYVGNERENFDPERPGDLKETFDINGWGMTMEESNIPDDVVPGFKKVATEFAAICKELSLRLLEVIAVGMDIKDRDIFVRNHQGMNEWYNYSVLRSLCYRSIPDSLEIKKGQLRLGEHTDYGSFTLVFQDQVGGLQIEMEDGRYIDAKPIPGTVLVNIGDSLQYWTRGRLRATVHRIMVPEDEKIRRKERNSIVYSSKANNECMLEEIKYGERHRSYRPPTDDFTPMTVGEFIKNRLQGSYVFN